METITVTDRNTFSFSDSPAVTKAKNFKYPGKEWDNLIYEFRLLRLSKGVTASELEAMTKTGKGTVSRFENGYNVTLTVLTTWARALGSDLMVLKPLPVKAKDYRKEYEQQIVQKDNYASKLQTAREEILSYFKELTFEEETGKYNHSNVPALVRMQKYMILNGFVKPSDCQIP